MTVHAAGLAEAQKLFDITPLQPSLGAEIAGIELSRPLDPAARDALWAALLTYKVLFFRDQAMTREEHIAFGAQFGDLEVHPAFALPDYPQILPLISSEMAGKYDVNTDSNWHADTTFRAAPSAASMLRALVSPSLGGDTVFANAVEAYERLPEDVKARIDGLAAVHDASPFLPAIPPERHAQFHAEHPPVEHPVVRVHPETGEKAIYVNTIFTRRILGVSEEESAELLRILHDQIKRPEFQVRWSWKPDSVAFWDNRATQHYAVNDYGELRHMERVTIIGDRPVGPKPN